MAENDNLMLGDSQISKFLFGTTAKRRLVPTLRGHGWPIFEVAGKSAARPSRLRDEIERREQAAAQGEAAA